jgi:hypothetical protein
MREPQDRSGRPTSVKVLPAIKVFHVAANDQAPQSRFEAIPRVYFAQRGFSNQPRRLGRAGGLYSTTPRIISESKATGRPPSVASAGARVEEAAHLTIDAITWSNSPAVQAGFATGGELSNTSPGCEISSFSGKPKWGSAHERESIPLTEYIPIFRVPEYSEYLLRTGFVLGIRWDELGILKRGEKGPLRIVGLAQRTGRIRCLKFTPAAVS